MISELLLTVTVLLAAYKIRPRSCVDFTKQTVVITGGSHGIGWALTKMLLREGAKVIILDLKRPPDAEVTRIELERLKYFQIDVADEVGLQAIQRDLRDQPTVLVNNAGIHNQGKRVDQLSFQEIRRIVDTNLLGPMWCTKVFLPSMMDANYGHVVNVASCLGRGGLNNVADYCATKFGVVGFNESLRLELKVHGYTGVKTTVVCPFLVQTGMFAKLKLAHPWLIRPLQTEEVAQAIFDAIKYRNSEEIWLPGILKIFPFIRVFPSWVYDWLQQALGSTTSFFYGYDALSK